MTNKPKPICQARQLRTGKRCTRPARYVISAAYKDQLVCGIHARGWIPAVRQPIGNALQRSRY
jgi:hypothetical protein